MSRKKNNDMVTLNLSLPDNLREFVEQEVAEGGYATVSEFIRSLVREDMKRVAEQEKAAARAAAKPASPAAADARKNVAKKRVKK